MTERQAAELEHLRTRYPKLTVIDDGLWVRIPRYAIPGRLWTRAFTPVAFQIPATVAQEPYAFYVPRDLVLKGGASIANRTDAATPFPGEWAMFSWAIAWAPGSELREGTTLLDFVTSFASRFEQGS
jgi:hypothetical protein